MNLIPRLGRAAAFLAAAGALHATPLLNLIVNDTKMAWDLFLDPGSPPLAIQVEIFAQGTWAPGSGPRPGGYLGRIPAGGRIRLALQDPPPLMQGVIGRLQPVGGARGPQSMFMLSPILGRQEHRITARGMAMKPWTGKAEPSGPKPARRRARTRSLESPAAQDAPRSVRPRLPALVNPGSAPPAASFALPTSDSSVLSAPAPTSWSPLSFPSSSSAQAPGAGHPASLDPNPDLRRDPSQALGTGGPTLPVRHLDIPEDDSFQAGDPLGGSDPGGSGVPETELLARLRPVWALVKNTTMKNWYLRNGSLPMACVVCTAAEGSTGLPCSTLYPAGSYGLIPIPPGCTTQVVFHPSPRPELWFEVVDERGWTGWGDLVQISTQGTSWHCGGPAAVRADTPIVHALPGQPRAFTIVRETWATSLEGEAGVPPPPPRVEAKAP